MSTIASLDRHAHRPLPFDVKCCFYELHEWLKKEGKLWLEYRLRYVGKIIRLYMELKVRSHTICNLLLLRNNITLK